MMAAVGSSSSPSTRKGVVKPPTEKSQPPSAGPTCARERSHEGVVAVAVVRTWPRGLARARGRGREASLHYARVGGVTM